MGFISEPDTKGGALFPRKIDGRFARIERPGEGRSLWVSFSDDLVHWGGMEIIIAPRGGFWDSSWIGVLEPRPGDGDSRRRRGRALHLLGFRRLAPALFVRPDNLRGGIDALRTELSALGLPPGDLVFELRSLDAVTSARARALWDSDALRTAHRELRTELEGAIRDFDTLPVDRAMVTSFLLGGQAIRQLVLDPLLPDDIAPGDERRELLETMVRYDRLGRTAWAGLLARFDVPHLGAPADTRMGAGADRLAR